MRHNILLLETIATQAHELLEDNGSVYLTKDSYCGIEIAKSVDIHAIVCRGKGDVNKQLIDQCPKLKVITRCGVGLDNINVTYAQSKGVQILNTPGVNSDTVAEQTMALMLMCQRQLYPIIADVKNGNWQQRNCYKGDEIRGKKLGIIGMGNIGQKVAEIAKAFGMSVHYWARENKGLSFPFVTLEKLFKTSDVISLHLPLSSETSHFINKNRLSWIQPHTIIVNTGRGGVIDELALREHLKRNPLSGFAADVMTEQPPREDHPLLKLPNVIITPHISSLTKRTYNEICLIAIKKTITFLENN